MMHRHEGFDGAPLLVFLVLLVIFGILAALAVWAVTRRQSNARTPSRSASSATAILDERFARGEIDSEEYLHRRAVLEGPSPGPGGPGPQGGQGPVGG